MADVRSQTKSKRPVGRPKGGRPATSREEVLAAAIRAVRAIGPCVTMDAIAAEASVTKPIVYRTLGDKEAVSEAVAEFLSLEVANATVGFLDQHPDPRSAFYAAIHAYFTTLAGDKELFLFVELGWASPDGKQLTRMIERAATPLIDRFELNNPGSSHGSHAATTWAYAVTGALRTIAMMWVREPYCTVEELACQLTDTFVTAPATENNALA